MRYCLLLLSFLFCAAPVRAQVSRKSKAKTALRNATVTFQLDPAAEQARIIRPATIGLRGNTAPLSWEKTYPLTDTNRDGIYEATITFSAGAATQVLEYKYVHDSTEWESSGNRVLPLKAGKAALPVEVWDAGPPNAEKLAAAALTQEMTALDQAMFAAYNARDVEKLMSFFAEDLEFYHDRGGLSTYQQNREASQDILSRANAPHRELVPGSLEVYPVKDYGAMVIGAHRFCHVENGRDDCGTFKFSAVWQKKDGVWKVTRMLSYAH